MIDANADEAVGLGGHSGLWRGVHDGAIDHVRDGVPGDAHFQGVGRLAVGTGLLDRVVLGGRLDVVGLLSGPVLDDEGAVLGDQEVDVVLGRRTEIGAAEDQAVVVGVTARLGQVEGGRRGEVARRRVGRIPEDARPDRWSRESLCPSWRISGRVCCRDSAALWLRSTRTLQPAGTCARAGTASRVVIRMRVGFSIVRISLPRILAPKGLPPGAQLRRRWRSSQPTVGCDSPDDCTGTSCCEFVGLVPGVALAGALGAAPATQNFSRHHYRQHVQRRGAYPDENGTNRRRVRRGLCRQATMLTTFCMTEVSVRLKPQKSIEQFAGQKVTVTGTLDAKTRTIQVEAIEAAKRAAPSSQCDAVTGGGPAGQEAGAIFTSYDAASRLGRDRDWAASYRVLFT